MDKLSSSIDKLKNYNYNYLPLGPRSDSYHDRLIFYCGVGAALSILVSLGFKTHFRSTLILGIGLPMGYLHKDLMKIIYDPTNSTALDALPDKVDNNNKTKE